MSGWCVSKVAAALILTSSHSGASGPKRAQPLGQFDATGLAPGDYLVGLEVVAPGQELITVRRPFAITGP